MVRVTLRSPGKPCLVKCFKWWLKVIKEQRAGNGHIMFLDQTTNGTIGSLKGTMPFGRGLVRTLLPKGAKCTH